jgi:glycosyltransferase involved in cell wall biosynthesis
LETGEGTRRKKLFVSGTYVYACLLHLNSILVRGTFCIELFTDLLSGHMARQKISAFVVCKNEERHIGLCLKSLSFCDEIVVVDSFSTDRTIEICSQFNVQVIQREWPGYRAQKEFACSQMTHDWVICLDADEYVSDPLREEVLSILEGTSRFSMGHYSGFYLNRVMFHYGKWWRKGGWYPEYRLRLFRKNEARWVGREPHENVEVDGPTTKLQGELYHFSYEDFSDQLQKLTSHAFTRAKVDFADGRTATISDMLFKPWLRFIKFYFLKKGYKEGKPAVVVGITEAFYVFLKYAKLWELQSYGKGMKPEPRTIEELKQIENKQ